MPLDFWIKGFEGEKPEAQLHFRELEPLMSAGERLGCALMKRLYAFHGADADAEFSPDELHSLIEEAVKIREQSNDNVELKRFLTELIDAAAQAAAKKTVLYACAN